MAVNMILTGAYIPVLFGFTDTAADDHAVQLSGVSYFTLDRRRGPVAVLLFIPAYLGIRFGTAFATVLGLLSMIPLTILARRAVLHRSLPRPQPRRRFRPPDVRVPSSRALGSSSTCSSPRCSRGTSIAMEAAGCYIGECKNPDRDAPIAMNLEGGYGVFIYTFLPLAVLGRAGRGSSSRRTPPTSTRSWRSTRSTRSTSPGLDKIVTAALLIALAAVQPQRDHGLRAVALHDVARRPGAADLRPRQPPQRARRVDGPERRPEHRADLRRERRVRIYVLSNVGYVGSFIPVLLGYYFLRRWRPEIHRPYRLPEWMKYVALVIAAPLLHRLGGRHPVVRHQGVPARRRRRCS